MLSISLNPHQHLFPFVIRFLILFSLSNGYEMIPYCDVHFEGLISLIIFLSVYETTVEVTGLDFPKIPGAL